MAPGRVTITDVAREAGVSIATVSRVIAGRGSVSPELAERVRIAAERLNYRPSPLARGLATGETGMVGVLVPNLKSLYFHELIKAIGAGAGQDGYHMLVLESNDIPTAEADLAASLYAHVDGVILCSPRMPEDDLNHLAVGRSRLMCLNRLPAEPPPVAIVHDIHGSMSRLVQFVYHLGHRRVAFLAGRFESWATGERWRAVQDAASLGVEPTLIPAGSSPEHGYGATDAALQAGCTALMANSDPAAIGILARLRELGKRVPEDVSVTGFGDILFSQYTCPALTTINVHRMQLGLIAWETMRSMILDEPVVPQSPPPGEVMARQTTGRAPGSPAARPAP